MNIVAVEVLELSFDNDIAHPAILSVHTLPNPTNFEKADIFIVCRLVTLVEIDDFRLSVLRYRAFYYRHNRRDIQTVRHSQLISYLVDSVANMEAPDAPYYAWARLVWG